MPPRGWLFYADPEFNRCNEFEKKITLTVRTYFTLRQECQKKVITHDVAFGQLRLVDVAASLNFSSVSINSSFY